MKMKYIWGITVLSFALLPISAAFGDEPQSPQVTINLPCRVYHVVDGDTLDVEMTVRFRIRLRDCWAPESRTKDLAEKKLGLASKENLTRIALGKAAILVIPLDHAKIKRRAMRIDDVQSLSRWLGFVYVDGKSISEQQVVGGFATKTKQKKVKP